MSEKRIVCPCGYYNKMSRVVCSRCTRDLVDGYEIVDVEVGMTRTADEISAKPNVDSRADADGYMSPADSKAFYDVVRSKAKPLCRHEHAPRVSVVVVNVCGGSTLLGNRVGTGWQWPGGKVDAGELLDAAARRECMEECGIDIAETIGDTMTGAVPRFVGLFQHTNEKGSWVAHLFVKRWSRRPILENCEPDKFSGWDWFDWDTLRFLAEPVDLREMAAHGRELGLDVEATAQNASGLDEILARILRNPYLPREERDPGLPTHCLHCRERFPCGCMT